MKEVGTKYVPLNEMRMEDFEGRHARQISR